MFKRSLLICVCAIALLTIPFVKAKAQSLHVIEDSIKFYLTKISDYSSYPEKYKDGKEDSTGYYNEVLRSYLKDVLVQQPLTLEYGFSKLTKGMKIATSRDRKFRIYSWDDMQGGTMRMFNSVFQFKVGKNVRALVYYTDTFIKEEWQGPGYFYPEVHGITSKEGKTYYLAIRIGIYSSAAHTIGVQSFSIENGGVNDSVKLFRTKTELLNNIDVEVDYTQLSYMPKEPEIHFSTDNKTIYIPLVTDKKATDKYLLYNFDGMQYVYSGVGRVDVERK